MGLEWLLVQVTAAAALSSKHAVNGADRYGAEAALLCLGSGPRYACSLGENTSRIIVSGAPPRQNM